MKIRLLLVTFLALSALSVLAQTAKAKHEPSTAENARTINLNTVSGSELDALLASGLRQLKKIIAGRPYSSVSDLQRAGIPKRSIDAPLVSMGGSSLWFTCFAIGIILSVARNVEQMEGNAAAQAIVNGKEDPLKKEQNE